MLVAFLLVSVVPLVASAALSFWRSTSLVESFLAENVGKTANAYAAGLDLFLERQRVRLRGVPYTMVNPVDVLASTVEGDPHLESLMLLDAQGSLVASSPSSVEAWAVTACTNLMADPTRVMTHAGEGHPHEVVVAVSRNDQVLCGQVSFTLHQDMLTEQAESANGGTAYIVDRAGTVVCHAFEEHEPHVDRGDALVGTAQSIASQGRTWSGTTQTSSGPAFAAYAPAGELPWGVWVEVPKEVVAGPLRSGLQQTLGYAALLAVIASGMALLIVRRLVGPIQDVVIAVRSVADGRYGEAIPVRGDDEVATLAREFNRMSTALASSYAELDDRVAQRTRELLSAQQFSDLLLDTMQERILVVDRELTIVRANDAALAAYGSEIIGCACKSVHKDAGAGDGCPVKRVLDSGQPESEERVFDRDGRTEIISVETYPLPGGDAAVEISRDVTDRKRIQAQLIHQEKMAALGTLAAGMAHEIGNPLASMSSELEMLEQMWDPKEARESLPVLRDQVRRMSSLLRELVEFGRRPSEETDTFDPAPLLHDVARLLRHDPRCRDIEVNVDAAEHTGGLCSSRDRVMQVLVNLGINALDAMDGAGKLTFRLAATSADTVRIEVNDTGPGLSDDVAKQVFDPFFTTKPPGRGTGLGLFVSERVVQGLGGKLELQSSPDGATFAVVLPDCNCEKKDGERHE
jgi:signal transduction histidine kinase